MSRARPFQEVAPGVGMLSLAPRASLNVYLLGDVLVDSATRRDAGRIMEALRDRTISDVALTHAHVDHQGASHAICAELDIPLWCGEGDRQAAESGDLTGLLPNPRSLLARVSQWMAGPGHPVSRALAEGDEVGDFRALETPGHTMGHLAFWRAEDRVLVLGDVLFNIHPITLRRGLREPIAAATVSREVNRESMRKLAALDPAVVCFGHGAPLRSPARIRRFVATVTGETT